LNEAPKTGVDKAGSLHRPMKREERNLVPARLAARGYQLIANSQAGAPCAWQRISVTRARSLTSRAYSASNVAA
jgi:hypothetical protein